MTSRGAVGGGLLVLAVWSAAGAESPAVAPLLKQLDLVAYRSGTMPPAFSARTVDAHELSLAELILRLNRLAGAYGIVFGLAIAGVIASYTLVDKRGLDYANPIAYLEVSMIAPAILYATWVARMRGGAAALRSELNRSSVVAGIATFTAYALVLAALQLASAASVAAVRETSVVIATLLAAVVLKEHVTPVRLTGAVLVACGVALLAAGG
jgi:uncharacterized membrane protein